MKIDPPIELIDRASKPIRTFSKIQDVLDFAEEQHTAWENFSKATANVKPAYRGNLSKWQIEPFQNLLNWAQDAFGHAKHKRKPEFDQHVERIREMFRSDSFRAIVFADTPRANHIFSELQKGGEADKERASLLLAVWNPYILDINGMLRHAESQSPPSVYLPSYLLACSAAQNFDAGIGSARPHADALQKLVQDFGKTQADATAQLLDTTSKLSERVTKLNNLEKEHADSRTKNDLAATKALEDMIKLFREHTRLRAPAEYWDTKGDGHAIAAYGWAAAFVAAIGGGAYWLFDNALKVKTYLADINTASPYAALAVALTIGFAAIWILRHLSRLFISNLHLMNDAKERFVMVRTFLALLEPPAKATAEDRILILHALFRPSPATGADDNAPPHWFDLLSERIRKPNPPSPVP